MTMVEIKAFISISSAGQKHPKKDQERGSANTAAPSTGAA